MERRTENILTAFEQYAKLYNAPRRYILWAGLYVIGTAVTRQVAMRAHGNDLHPNFFIQMIGGPSAGKSQTTRAVRDVLRKASDFSFIPASTTRAGLEDYMQANLKQRLLPNGSINLSSECIGLSEELQGILPDQDLGHLTLYNILFDCPPQHKAITRTNGEVVLESPYCSIFAGAQPSFLALTMPEQAWGMGFMSRSILVWDTIKERRSAFNAVEPDHKLLADIIHDVKGLSKTHGYMTWTKAAQALYEEWWVNSHGAPVPSAKRLAMGYNGRRDMHFFKVAMALSLAESNDLIVEERHAIQALKMLLDVEEQMKNIFNEMANTGSSVAIEDLLDEVRANTANDQLTPESLIIQKLMQRFPSTQVHAIIENLVTSGALIVAKGGSNMDIKGFRKFSASTKTGM